MDRDDAVSAMAGHGFTAEQRDMGKWHLSGWSEWCVEFSKPESHQRWSASHPHRPAVKCYFIDDTGLTCVLVDGLVGPQVTHEGIRLIGRVPSELAQEMEAFADEHDTGITFSPGGDMIVSGFKIELGAQRAGDVVVTWAVFFNTGKIAGSSYDIVPTEAWRHW